MANINLLFEDFLVRVVFKCGRWSLHEHRECQVADPESIVALNSFDWRLLLEDLSQRANRGFGWRLVDASMTPKMYLPFPDDLKYLRVT